MAGARKNSKRTPKGPARQGAVADAAKPTRVKKSTGTRRTCASAIQGTATQTAANQTAANQTAANQTAQNTQVQAPAPRRRGVLSADVLANINLFGLRDPDDIATRNRRAAGTRTTTTSGTRSTKKATKATKKKTLGRRPVAATAPVAHPTQPAAQTATRQEQQSPPNNVEPEADEQPANDDTAPVDDAVANDLAANQEAEREAAEVEEAMRVAAAAKDRADKERAEKEADKNKREADEKKRAAKLKADREQAKRDEAARLAQEEADREQAEEAARAKAAREQKAAEEEAAQKQKDAEEAARQKEAQEKAAAQEKVAKAKAVQEKAAAELKAAQEKEQVAKTKAAQDEAAKAAAQKKAADDVAAFKKAEEEAKVEKLRQAKEQKDKEAKELLEKEARGLKRPGMKRAAPPTDDQANKKTKTEDRKPSCKRFEEDLRLAKFNFGNHVVRTPDGPVKFGSHLNLDIIFQALAAVTEAVNDEHVEYEQDKRDKQGKPDRLTDDAVDKLWGLFHPRSLVDHNIVDHPVILPRHEALLPIDKSFGRKTHFSLVALVQTEVESRHGRDFFAMHHYDCDPSLRAVFHNTFARQTVKSQIVHAGWARSRKGEIDIPFDQSESRKCCDRLPGPEQEWTTGIHAILNGWVCALKLKHNKDALLSKEGFYEKAVDLVNLAIRGLVTSRMILDFFDCYEYVEKDDLPEAERRRRTFTGTKNFETYPRLHKYILGLLGRQPAVDIDDVTTPRTGPTETTEKPLGSGRRTGDYPPSNLDAFLRGTDGREEMPKTKPDAAEPKEGPVADDGYDSARSDNDDDDEPDEDDEGDAVIDDKEPVVEAPKTVFDWRGKVMTPEALAAEAAARAAVKERKEREKREREEREAAAREAAAAESVGTDDQLLFGDDDDEDINDFYNNNELSQKDTAVPTSAPRDEIAQDDPEEDLHTSSRSPRRQTQPQPPLQPTVVDEKEEDLYGLSPPRNRHPLPTAPISNLHLPGPPPPTPHDPYVAQPFLFPTMYPPVPPAPPVTKPSFNLVSENGPVLPPSVPPSTSGRNPGFRVPSMSLSPEAKSKLPSKPATTGPRQFTNPNPRGTYRVPDTLSDSSGTHDDDVLFEQNGFAQTNAAQDTTTQPAAAQPTQAEIDEEAWAVFENRAPSPGLEAAMADYDRDQREYSREYEGQSLAYTGDYDSEPDAEVEVRQVEGDDVRYGDVPVEENGEKDEEVVMVVVEEEEEEEEEEEDDDDDGEGKDEIDYNDNVDESYI
ncbi:hypothetical protein MBLNU13_g04639t1 [Cladosporium sp. NU13]